MRLKSPHEREQNKESVYANFTDRKCCHTVLYVLAYSTARHSTVAYHIGVYTRNGEKQAEKTHNVGNKRKIQGML